jgi:hypothetical protein
MFPSFLIRNGLDKGHARNGERARHIATRRSLAERVTVRQSSHADGEGIRRLAALDSKDSPQGPVLLAEVDGELVAAVPFDGGAEIADPFRPTADLVNLLRLRATQVAA